MDRDNGDYPLPEGDWDDASLFTALQQVEEGALDVEIVFEDTAVFVDPVVVCPAEVTDAALDALGARREELRTLLNGLQVHRCAFCEPGKVYVLDRPHVVDETGVCRVCRQPTT